MRTRSHRRTETCCRRLRALYSDDERTTTALVIDGITVFVSEQHAILHGDRRQFACSSSQERMWTFGFCLIVQDAEHLTLALGRPESDIRRMQVSLPALRSHCVSKKGIVFAALETITPRFLFVGPSSRQILD